MVGRVFADDDVVDVEIGSFGMVDVYLEVEWANYGIGV